MISDKDLDRCARIERECWKENFAPLLGISEYLYFQTDISVKKELTSILENKDAHILLSYKKTPRNFEVEEFNKDIAGFAIVRLGCNSKNIQQYYIDKLYISPEFQHQGIGQSMLEAIINAFNNYSINLSIIKENRIAEHILLKNGFKKTTEKKLKLEYGKNVLPITYSYFLLERN